MSVLQDEQNPITCDQLVEITNAVWQSFVETELEWMPVDGDSVTAFTSGVAHYAGVVQVAGDVRAMVLLQSSPELVHVATRAMFMMEPEEVTDSELADAFGELVNMIGGNIKGLFEGANQLSLPTVTRGQDHEVLAPGTQLVEFADFNSNGQKLRVSVWRPSN
jgi:chemotaxis protein CheX